MPYQFFIFFSIMGWGFGSFFYKIANSNIHPVMVSTVSMGLYIVLLPLMWTVMKFDHHISLAGVLYSLAGAAFMCIATLSFSYALHNGGPAGRITILTALYPVLTLILSMIFLGETLTIKKSIGIICALVSFIILA